MTDDARDERAALRAIKDELTKQVPPRAQDGEVHVVPIQIVPKEDGGRMYAVSTGGFAVYPEPKAVVTVHRDCQDCFDHERLADMTTLGYAALDASGDLLGYELADPAEVHDG